MMRHYNILILWIIGGTYANLAVSKNASKSGVIVNPFYDPKDDVNKKEKSMNGSPDPDVIRPPTYHQLAETENIRNIINNAVQSGTYVVGDGKTSIIQPKKPIFSWLSLLAKSNNDLSSTNSDEDMVGSKEKKMAHGKGSSPQLANVVDSSKIQSNSIDSAIVSELDKKPLSITPRRVQREQLQLVSIEEDLKFPHGQNIRSWITIQGKTSDQHALVGITNSSLVLIVEKSGIYEIVEELDFKTTILCFTNYLHWNHTSKSVHGVIIVGIENQLIFVSTREDFNGMKMIWTWTIHSAIRTLVYFTNDGSDKILMINSPTATDDRISADIYKFDVNARHTWLVQKIPLKDPCKSAEIINTYRELVLCFVQNNTVELYKSDRYASSKAFKFSHSIEANNVQTVSGFQMGGYSYLAITGFEPKILRYHRGNFSPQTILSRSWGLVEFVYPVPARTYRDDLILLVQHRIMLGTHSVSVVEALIWDGESFDVSLSIPCRIGDDVVEFGLTCLLDYDRDAGIDGLAIIQNGNSISLIIPRLDAPSTIFRLRFELKSYESPDVVELKDLELALKDVEMMMTYQNDVLSKGNKALERVVRNDGSSNDVSALWHLTTATTDSLILNDGLTWNIDEIYFGNEKLTENEFNLDIPDLMSILQELKTTVEQLEKESMDNHMLESGVESHVQARGNGNFDMKNAHILKDDNRLQGSKTLVKGKFDMKNARVMKDDNRVKRSETPANQMDVNKLQAKRLNVDFINGIPIDDIVFIQDGVLNSVDSLVVENHLNVLSEVKLSSDQKEIVGENIEDRHLKDANNMHVNGDLVIDSINGVLWQDFVQQIVMRNLPNFLAELSVQGDILLKEDIAVHHLNRISFLKDFLWMHDSDVSRIAGQKVFKGTLTTDSVDTSGTVDGINTHETISLSEQQYIRGLTTFTQLEVTESLDVNGTINGKHLNEFKPNPSLLEANIIPSDCLFQNLQVQGPIYISNDCNGIVIDDILADVVYKSNPKTTINSFKTFESVESTIELTSNLINDIPIGNYMTVDTQQDLSFDRLIGNVMFRQLYTNGLFDFINVTELDQNSIKLMGEQFTEAEIIFESNDELNIDTEAVEILNSFNGLVLSDLIRIDESLEINGNVVINSVLVNELTSSGPINGKRVVNGVVLEEFDGIRFSRSRPQDITSKYHIERTVIENDLDATFVNGVDIEDLKKHISLVKNLPDFLTSMQVKLSNLMIDGNLVVNAINGHEFNAIKDNAVWLNQPNTINGSLEFLDQIVVVRGVIANNVNNEIFDDFVTGLVLRTEEDIEFSGRKIFQREFHIEQDMVANTINGIFLRNIWTKSSTHDIRGHVIVQGNLVVENLNIQRYLNWVYLGNIQDKYSFDVERQAHVLTNNIRFTSPTVIQDLRIQNGLNGVINVTEFLSNVIRKNHNGLISGKKQFKSNVIFLNDLQVGIFDAVDISTLFDNIVINEINETIIIFGDVAFENDVEASLIHISGDILASTVMDCSLSEWHKNALRTNFPVKIFENLIFPVGTFRTEDVSVQYVNGYQMADVITLNTEQNLRGQSIFSDVLSLNNIDVGGLVNGQNIRDLLENSVMVTGDHYITAPTTFLQSARVLDVLQTIGTVNGKNLNNIATLHEDLHLFGPFSFRTISAKSLNTKDHISGIDFDYWHGNSLWKSQRETQIISGTWSISNGIFRSPVSGQATLNGIPVQNLAGQIAAHQSNVQNNLDVFNRDYIENCRKMANLIQKTRNIPYFLSHFEESFSIREQNLINSVHFFEANDHSYLVINSACMTMLYVWNKITESYERICETETGNADGWLDILDESNVIHLISNTEVERSNCLTSGLHVWKFDGSTLVHVTKMADSNKFSFLHSSNSHPKRFLALTKDNDKVNEFDLQNNLVEEWHLPLNGQQFRFLPQNTNLGLALSNGKQLSVLSSTKSGNAMANRNLRSTDPFNEAIGENVALNRKMRCSFLDKRLQNFTENCKLLQQAKLWEFSSIGPFRNLEPATGYRLMTDYKLAKAKLGMSPSKLKLIPSERGPLSGPNFLPIEGNTSKAMVKNDSQTVNATNRDAFGDVEKVLIDVADNLVDTLIEVDTNDDDIDFDDSFIGSSPKNQSQNSTKSEERPSNSTENDNSQGTSSRDMFGNIEAKTVKFVDKVMDVYENIKDKTKDSQAKLSNLFHLRTEGDGHNRNSEPSENKKKTQSKNLPRIPQVSYNNSNIVVSSDTTLGSSKFPHDVIAEDTTTTTEDTTTTTEATTADSIPDEEDVGGEEQKISKEIFSEGIATAENFNFPNHPAEEIVAITVGETQKNLIAVSSLRYHTIQGKHDLIRIYEDIIEGKLFQTIICHRPRSLSVLRIRDESILAFIENDAEVQIYVYRGIQGFVKYTSLELPSYVLKITSIHLPVADSFACSKSYLVATMKREIRFIEAKSCGYCGVNAQLRCD